MASVSPVTRATDPGPPSISGPLRPSTPSAADRKPFHPTADQATYRDLLLFEERLKMNAEMLRRRRRRYSAFLWSFASAMLVMGYRLLFLPPSTLFKLRILQAASAVVFITLALFFASGMYEEKIRYAHAYINHSNKALRPLNMHLNMRRPLRLPSVTSLFSSLTSLLPFSLPIPLPLLDPTAPLSTHSPLISPSSPPQKPALVPSPRYPNHLSPPSSPTFPHPTSTLSTTGIPHPSVRRPSTNSKVLAHLPASSNPRGELIFSSRVNVGFREGYERYRSAFERRREEKAREERRKRGWWGIPGLGAASAPGTASGSSGTGARESRRGVAGSAGRTKGGGGGSASRGRGGEKAESGVSAGTTRADILAASSSGSGFESALSGLREETETPPLSISRTGTPDFAIISDGSGSGSGEEDDSDGERESRSGTPFEVPSGQGTPATRTRAAVARDKERDIG